jgi:hypothetical protein
MHQRLTAGIFYIKESKKILHKLAMTNAKLDKKQVIKNKITSPKR